MNYTPFILGLLGISGILFHNLIQLYKINKKTDGKASIFKYLRIEIYSILIALLMVFVSIVVLDELNQISYFSSYRGLGFIAIGYMGQSLLVFFIGKAEKVMGKENEQE